MRRVRNSPPQLVDSSRTTFILEHPDLNQSNLFVCPDLMISCVIDWEFASAVPCESFCVPPHLPSRRDPLKDELRHVFEKAIENLEFRNHLSHFRFSNDQLRHVTANGEHGGIFTNLLTRKVPMWAYDRLVQNEAFIEFHSIVDEFLSWSLGERWRDEFKQEVPAD